MFFYPNLFRPHSLLFLFLFTPQENKISCRSTVFISTVVVRVMVIGVVYIDHTVTVTNSHPHPHRSSSWCWCGSCGCSGGCGDCCGCCSRVSSGCSSIDSSSSTICTSDCCCSCCCWPCLRLSLLAPMDRVLLFLLSISFYFCPAATAIRVVLV